MPLAALVPMSERRGVGKSDVDRRASST